MCGAPAFVTSYYCIYSNLGLIFVVLAILLFRNYKIMKQVKKLKKEILILTI